MNNWPQIPKDTMPMRRAIPIAVGAIALCFAALFGLIVVGSFLISLIVWAIELGWNLAR